MSVGDHNLQEELKMLKDKLASCISYFFHKIKAKLLILLSVMQRVNVLWFIF